MKIIELEKETDSRHTRDKIKDIAGSLKKGQGIPIAEVAQELQVSTNTVRQAGKSIGCYAVKYIAGKQAAFITSLSK